MIYPVETLIGLNDPIFIGKRPQGSTLIPARLLVATNTLITAGNVPELGFETDFQEKSGAFVLSLQYDGAQSLQNTLSNNLSRGKFLSENKSFFDGTHAVQINLQALGPSVCLFDMIPTLPSPILLRLASGVDQLNFLRDQVPFLNRMSGVIIEPTSEGDLELIKNEAQKIIRGHMYPAAFQTGYQPQDKRQRIQPLVFLNRTLIDDEEITVTAAPKVG
ncbi:hypothetical protein [Flexibacterium corallicola]|uniref:hypothetical protein n=1 Tax=Flexibacterium corallicola TaxID=3037259 RepID=UPI00286FADB3|nr:hypothetical protein [Pseudovibrio sp. M1P-2-3]